MKKSYVELKEERKRVINKHLNTLKEEGKIKDWYFNKYQYWQGIPYIELNNGRKIPLAKTYLYLGSLGVTTIYDTKRNIIKRITDTIINEIYE